MRPLSEMAVIQIDILSSCHLSCANCTRFVSHHKHNYAMDADCFRKAIASLDGFPGRIGLMGGEPLLHPRFRELLAIYCEMVPKERRELWTAGWKWTEYAEELADAFEPSLIHFNDHTQEDGRHQPLGVAVSEVVEDEDLMWELIRACPYQEHWSAAVNDHGAYMCEIGAAQDRVLNNGANAWPVESGWWKRKPGDPEFEAQVKALCVNCSGCLPMPAYSDGRGGRDGPTYDVVSPGFLGKLLANGSPKAKRGHVQVWNRKITREDIDKIKGWSPRSFRGFVAHSPEDYEHAGETGT